MKMKSFGVVNQAQLKDNDVDRYVEELSILGYSIIEDVLTDDELKTARIKLDEVYAMQVKEFSEEELGIWRVCHLFMMIIFSVSLPMKS